MPRRPTELDVIEHHLQAAARTIRDSRPGDLAVERMRGEIYKHVYEAIEICARYAYGGDSSRDSSRSPLIPLPASPGGGVGRRGGGGGDDLAADLDFLKE